MTTAHTTSSTSGSPKPTPNQLRYLRDLATKRGESFALPRTRADASREIDRLKSRPTTPRSDVRRESKAIRRDMSTCGADAARIREDEVTGYGSRATWSTDRLNTREQSAAPKKTSHADEHSDSESELGRYTTTNDGVRIVYGQRINGFVRLIDVPATRCGRRIVLEDGLTSKAETDAIVADYLAQAAALDAIPAIASTL